MGGMRGWCGTLLAFCAGCGFDSGAGSHKPADASVLADVPADMARDAGDVGASAFCDPQDANVGGVLRARGKHHRSLRQRAVADGLNVTFVAGRVGMAAHFGATTRVDIAETPALDIPAMNASGVDPRRRSGCRSSRGNPR